MTARRRPSPQPGRRRPVAGIRRPGAPSPSPRPKPAPEPEDTEDAVVESPDTDATAAADDGTRVVPETDAPATETGEEPFTSDAESAEGAASNAAEPEAEASEIATPKPKRKSRDAGAVKPTGEGDVVDAPSGKDRKPKPAKPAAKGPSGNVKTLIAAGVGVLLTAAAVFFGWQYFATADATDNGAMSDAAETSQVKDQAQDAVQKIFSYQPDKIDQYKKDVDNLLVGDKVRKEYEKLYPDVEEKAPKQKITAVTKVAYSSVLDLDDDRANVLVFLEQSSWRGNDKKGGANGGGILKVTMARDGDDRWKVEGLDTYPQKNAAQPGPTQPSQPNGKSSEKPTEKPTTTKKGN